MKPVINEEFSDNGAHSHWSVIDADTGRVVITDIEKRTEPADAGDPPGSCAHSYIWNHVFDIYTCMKCGAARPAGS